MEKHQYDQKKLSQSRVKIIQERFFIATKIGRSILKDEETAAKTAKMGLGELSMILSGSVTKSKSFESDAIIKSTPQVRRMDKTPNVYIERSPIKTIEAMDRGDFHLINYFRRKVNHGVVKALYSLLSNCGFNRNIKNKNGLKMNRLKQSVR